MTVAIAQLPHWDDEPDVWDALFLGGVEMPGWARVKCKRGKKVDVKNAKGKNKAKLTLQGYEPAQLTITIRLHSREELQALADVLPMLEPVADKAKATDLDALDIANATTTLRNITAIVITELDGPELDAGIMTLTITAYEFDAPKAKSGLGTGGSGAGGVEMYDYDIIGTFVNVTGAQFGAGTIFARKLNDTSGGNSLFEERPGPNSHGTFEGRLLNEDVLAKARFDAELAGTSDYNDISTSPSGSKSGYSQIDPDKNLDIHDPATVEVDPGT